MEHSECNAYIFSENVRISSPRRIMGTNVSFKHSTIRIQDKSLQSYLFWEDLLLRLAKLIKLRSILDPRSFNVFSFFSGSKTRLWEQWFIQTKFGPNLFSNYAKQPRLSMSRLENIQGNIKEKAVSSSGFVYVWVVWR